MFLGTPGSMSERRRLPITILRSVLLRVAFLLALIIVVHQFVMATSAHAAIMPMMDRDAQASVPTQDSHDCLYCPVHTTAICPAVQALLPHGMSAILLLFVALVTTAFFVSVIGPGVIASADWRPLPKFTRVLFQTFRC